MGRTRKNFDYFEDPIQSRKRKRKNAANTEKSESTSMGTKGKGKYKCDNCQKDITGKFRIKCAVCTDFDLCVECMSVGAEINPHKCDHPYRVIGNLTFPLVCPDWSADDEMLLLEGLEIYGMGKWTEVAEHVATKSKEQCIEHYGNIYLNSPVFPLPDMSHVAGKNRKELQAIAKGRIEDNKEQNRKEEYPFSPPKLNVEDAQKESHTDMSFGGKKHVASVTNGLLELSNYKEKREEFDPEFDNDAEQLVADMEFKENDTPEEHELKLRVLRIYSKRLDERKRRKEFILERNLLEPNPFEKDLSQEEKVQCRRFDAFMRFHSKEEHDELLHSVVSEHRMLKQLKDLKEAQVAGCRSKAEAERYLVRKRKRENEEEKSQIAGTPPVQPSSSYVNDWDMIGFMESQLLSESEKHLCSEAKLVPPVYLHMEQVMSDEIFKGNVRKKSDAYRLFKIDPTKVDRVYDMLVKKGIAQL